MYETFLFRNMDLLARMHSNSLVHNDFHLYNLLAKSAGEQLEIYWLDFSGVKNFSKLRPSRCYRDLAVFLRSGGFAPALREKLLQHYHFCRMRYTVGETPPIQYLPLHRAAFSGSSC